MHADKFGENRKNLTDSFYLSMAASGFLPANACNPPGHTISSTFHHDNKFSQLLA
jgi:hypothetical protein